MTPLVQSALGAGHDTVFVFTPPGNAPSFQALNFRLLAAHGQAALLEHGPGLEAYLAGHARLVTPGPNGAVVVNGNPFTLGHLHLVESAARQVRRLYLFVVREDRSVFPFPVRLRLAQEATAHLANVTVLDTSRYAVSAGTFPVLLPEAPGRSRGHPDGGGPGAVRPAPGAALPHRPALRRPGAPVPHHCGLQPHDGGGAARLRRGLDRGAPGPGGRRPHQRQPRAGGAARRATLDGLEALVPPATLAYLRSPQAAAVIENLRARMGGA